RRHRGVRGHVCAPFDRGPRRSHRRHPDEGRRPVIEIETGLSAKDFAGPANTLYHGEDLAAPPASGSHRFRALVVVPCSGTTLAKIATGIADNLVTRAAAVALKERRPLVLVPRETPLSAIVLENLLKLARL